MTRSALACRQKSTNVRSLVVVATIAFAAANAHAQLPPNDILSWHVPVVGQAELAHRRGLQLSAAGEWREARRAFEDAVRADPVFALGHYNLGVALVALQLPGEAIRAYERAVRYEPRFTEARINLGVELAKVGRHDSALGHLRRAVRDAPQMAAAHHNLGVVLAQIGESEEALKALERAATLSPDDPIIQRDAKAVRLAVRTARSRRIAG